MKSTMLLWKMIADDFAIRCRTSATRDIKTVSGRFKHEGMSFFTISLPSFCHDFQKSLDIGLVDRNLFTGFSYGRTGTPLFLGGFLDLVFDRGTGVLVDEPDMEAILAIRQLTLLYSKILLPCSDVRVRRAMSSFIDCEQDVKRHDSIRSSSDEDDFRRVGRVLFSTLFSKVDSDIYYGNIVPKHGPGATADKLRGNSKYRQSTWTARLEEYFPFSEYIFPSWSYYDQFEDIDILEPGQELPVKVTPVPKTLKTPRIIAIEPTATQYVQQGIMRNILAHLKGIDILSTMVGFDDQTPNQRMAHEGSLTGSLATLDLSDASDRVSNQLVRLLLADTPHLLRGVLACRSQKADVPGYGVIPLAKFASMGSALCFPFEAFVFLTCVFLGIERELSTPVCRHLVQKMSNEVRIYGDDIIVPKDVVHSVVDTLEGFGARVNIDKSFWIGRFRESCGKEYYDGHDVSIVKVRRMLPTHRKDVQGIISTVSLRNQLYKAGCWSTVRWLDQRITGLIHHFPHVEDSSPVLGRVSFLGITQGRECRHLHKPLVKGFCVTPKIPVDHLQDHGALLKCLTKGLVAKPPGHLERSGRPHAVDIKLRWAPPR